MAQGRVLDLWPLTSVRKLAKQLRMQPAQLMRRVGWTKNRRRYYLEVKQPLPELDAGTYATPSLAMCMIPATIASAVAEERGMRTRLVDPDPPPLAPTVMSAAGPSTPVIAVLAHVDHGKTTLLDKLMGTNVAAGEVGLITQSVRPALLPLAPSIGGFSQLAFIDTPGHQDGLPMRTPAPAPAPAPRLASPRLTSPHLTSPHPTSPHLTPPHQAFRSMRGAVTESADLALVLVAVDAGIQPYPYPSLPLTPNP
jgi:hypothetical protein